MTLQDYNAAITAIYDFEKLFPVALAAVFTAAGLTAGTSTDTSDFQLARPRVEFTFTSQGAQFKGNNGATLAIPSFQYDPAFQPVAVLVPIAYRGSAVATIVTNSAEADKAIHAQYRIMTRFIMDTLGPRINNITLPNHKVQFVTPSGTVTGFDKEKGYWLTGMTFDVDFSIQPSAFASLIQPPTA